MADSAESNAPIQAFEKELPIEDEIQKEETQELKSRKKSADLHRVRRVNTFRFLHSSVAN